MLLVFLLLFSSLFTVTKCLTPTELFNSLLFNGKLQIDLNDANSVLDKIYEMAKIVKSEELNYKKTIKKLLDKKLAKNLEKLLNHFEEQAEFINIPYKSAENRKKIEQKNPKKDLVEAQLFNLLFSFAVRLEAIVHGKKEDGTIEEEENAEKAGGEKIQTFLAALGKFNLPEWANNFSIFAFWMEIKNIKQKEGSSSSSLGVEIKINREKNDEALAISRENFQMLKRINEQKFSIYETTKMLRKIYDAIALNQNRSSSSELVIPEIFNNLVDQISRENVFKRNNDSPVYRTELMFIRGSAYVILFQNISKKFMKMMADEGIDQEKHFNELDKRIQTNVAEWDFPLFCKKFKYFFP